MILVAHNAPNFISPAVLKNGKIVENFNFLKNISNKMAILFFWPMDFTFVCPSEIISFNKLYGEFEKRNVEIIGVSIDSVYVHNAWRNTPIQNGGIGKIKFTMVSDIKREIQQLYGVEHPHNGVSLRASFIIDNKKIIRHESINDLPLGRNIKDLIRIIDSIQFHENSGNVCPANWKKGKKGIKATPEGIAKYLSKN
ncbi:peroxiredoxin C [Buchnera aphidicola]|uniref:peroxiredoxin C n=1 Tax=Buchnera aphidicola TaxID=9 RepID=UPI0031B83FC0